MKSHSCQKMNQSWINSAINNWKAVGIRLNSGTSLDSIMKTEKKVGLQFPDDFKELYFEMNGFLDWDWTPTMFSLWSIERIFEECDPHNEHNFLGFCDYLINNHNLGFIRNQPGIFKYYGTDKPTLIAQSFLEVIQLINIDADILY